jgi:5-carboxymethyl-2-hydroxymuconate isomerase
MRPVVNFRLGLEGSEFVHVQCRIHSGRDELQKKLLTERILEALSKKIITSSVMTCEVVEMDQASYSKSIIKKLTLLCDF